MYNYMVFNVSDKKLYKDFLGYNKRNPCDELYFVSINNEQLLKYLEEFIERRRNQHLIMQYYEYLDPNTAIKVNITASKADHIKTNTLS